MNTLRKIPAIIVMIVVSALGLHAQPLKDKAANTKIEKVTVYLNGAHIYRNGTVNLHEGVNRIIIPYVSRKLIKEKIQAQVGGGARLMGIDYKEEYMDRGIKKDSIRMTRLQDSLKIFEKANRKIEFSRSTYEAEKKMIESNSMIHVSDVQASTTYTAELLKLSSFYSTRLMEVNRQLYLLSEEEILLKEKTKVVKDKISDLTNKERGEMVPMIKLSVFADAPMQVPVNVSYLVGGAAWTPKYLINVEDANAFLMMDYNANIMNQTGEDWNNVNLTLSTADPNRSNSLPTLSPWIINKYSRNTEEGNLDVHGSKKLSASTVKSQTGVEPLQGVEYEEIFVPETDIDFKIADKYSILSDGVAYTVNVSKNKLKASYDYYSIPKLEKEAFLVAQITGWEKLDLIEGVTSIYYQGRYIGESTITPQYANDTLDISLGRTQKVLINRIKTEDKNDKKIIANDVTETVTYKTTLRNTSSAPMTILVEDQLPISQDEEVKVTMLNTSGASADVVNGMLTWKLNLKPGESKELTLSFSVQYPKNKSGQFNLFNSSISKKRTRCKF